MQINKYLDKIRNIVTSFDKTTFETIDYICIDIEQEFNILNDTVSVLKDELKYKHEEIRDLKQELKELYNETH